MAAAKRKLIFAVALGALAVGGVTGIVFMNPSTMLTPVVRSGTCLGMYVDSGIGRRPIDARTEAGVRIWALTMTGHARVAPTTLAFYDGDFGSLLVEAEVTEKGAWSQEVPLSLGWHKLIVRATSGATTEDTVYWIGLAENGPTWSNPGPMETGNDAGTLCADSGCYRLGVVPRCGNGPILATDAGIIDANHATWGDPIGCVRGCGSMQHYPDGGCEGGACPGRVDSGPYFRPYCCSQELDGKGWRFAGDWTSPAMPGLDSELGSQPTAGSTLTVVSTAAGDKGRSVQVYGVDSAGFPRAEVLVLDAAAGTTPAAGTIRWGTVTGFVATWTPAGTVTVTSTTGGQTVATLSAANPERGIHRIGTRSGSMTNSQPIHAVADGATSAPITVVSTENIWNGLVLAGTSTVTTEDGFDKVTSVALGAVPAARTVTLNSTAGWCSSSKVELNVRSQSRGDILLALNFAGIKDDGCGAGHVLVTLAAAEKPWPPPSGLDAGYGWDAHVASRYRKYDYTCRLRTPGKGSLPVARNRDAGRAGIPFCSGNWCCVLSRVYPTPE